MGLAQQLTLLLWKNYLLQKRQFKVTIVQMVIPILFACLLIALRHIPHGGDVLTPTTWNSFSIPSVTDPDQGCLLYYSQNTSSITRKIMDGVMRRMESIKEITGFDSETHLVRAFMKKLEDKQRHLNQSDAQNLKNNNSCDVLAAVVFLELPNIESDRAENVNGDSIKYKLRFPSTLRSSVPRPGMRQSRWNTEVVFPVTETAGPHGAWDHGGPLDYVAESFLSLQYSIDLAIIEVFKNDSIRPDEAIDLKMERFPYPPYKADAFIVVIQRLLPLLIMLGFFLWSMLIVRDIVYEKEQRLKESMRMMGLDRRMHWLAWFLRYLFLLIITVGIETWLLVASIGTGGPVLCSVSSLLLFAFLTSYVVATIAFCFAVSTLFSGANLATAMGGLLFFISYVPYFFLQPLYESLVWPVKVVVCFLSNVAMAFGANVIGEFESSGRRLDWATLYMASSTKDFTLLYVLLLLWFDALLYCIFAWYMDAVFPGEYGIAKPWNFPFQNLCLWLTNRSTIRGQKEVKILIDDGAAASDEDSEADESVLLMNLFPSGADDLNENLDRDNFEPDPADMTPGIVTINLNKEFCNGSSRRVAVADLTLNVYEGQVTVLLGHNGAGKTTTFSMLAGLYPASSGKAFLNGFDVARDTDLVRQSLGICPQNSVLFHSLTVEEHLVFFCQLKTSSVGQTVDEVAKMLSSVDLLSRRSALVSTLSGGMKRKLSVAIAFIGGSKVVILDEPTSGMDPYSQRQTWDLIRRCRPGRTVLLSTQSMDEAEVLGDRIAIMVNGVIKCCGSPMFLKNRYGSGYRLALDKYSDCNICQLTNFIKSHIPEAQLKSCLHTEVSYLLPCNSIGKFADLFDGIDHEKEKLRIINYGISVATLMEVFLRVSQSVWSYETSLNTLSVIEDLADDKSFLASGHLVSKHLKPLVSCFQMGSQNFLIFVRHFCAMFRKKILHTVRSQQVIFARLVVPLVFVILPLIFLRGSSSARDSPPLTMDLSIFSNPVVAFGFGITSSPDRDLENFASNYSSVFTADVTMVNVNNSELSAKQCGSVRRYLVDEGKKSLLNYVRHFEIAICLSRVKYENLSLIKAVAFFNNEAYHTPAVSLNAFDNAMLRYLRVSSRWKIQTINHPLPRSLEETLKETAMQGLEGYAIVFSTISGMSFLASSFVLFLIHERSVGAKRCQLTSGATVWSFWSSAFVCDWIVLLVPCLGVIASFAMFHVEPFAGDGRWVYVALLFLVYGWAVLPSVYLASLSFTVSSSGFIWLTVVNIVFVFFAMIVEFLNSVGLDIMYIVKTLELACHLVPNYSLMKGLLTLYTNYNLLSFCHRDDIAFHCTQQANHPCCTATCTANCFVYSENVLGMDSRSGIGLVLIFLGLDGLLYFLILLLINSGRFRNFCYRIQTALTCQKMSFMNLPSDRVDLPGDDDDVAAERRRIHESSQDILLVNELVLLKELTKNFGQQVAVDRLSIGIRGGECFGLLGVNGAGKTTVFQMIVGDTSISKGFAFLYGQDVKKTSGKVGYCPQTDALLDELTGRELLFLYACLRGVDHRSVQSSIQDLIGALLLRTDADRLVKSYSGGTRRKLCTAVALVGWPRVILLDEPSTGLDPIARRNLWAILLQLRDSGRTIVLSSHSMDECETLCTRLAIMANGRFQCLGSSQHLKSRYGNGFTLSIKVCASNSGVRGSDEAAAPVETHLRASFPGSCFKKINSGILVCRISDESVRLGLIFQTMQTLQSRLPAVEDYAVTQTTLEEVFLSFASTQLPSEPGICWRMRLTKTVCRFVHSLFCWCCSTNVKKRLTSL